MSRRAQKFKEEWANEFNWCHPSKDGEHFAWCNLCGINVSIAGGGKVQLYRHASTQKHTKALKTKQTQAQLTFQAKKESKQQSTLKAEVKWAMFSAEHNLSNNVSDEFGDLLRACCPDSEIAKGFTCARSKTGYLISDGIRPALHDEIVRSLRTTKFSLLIDESNKTYNKKFLHLLVRYFHKGLQQTVTQFYKAVVLNKGTAENIVNALDAALVEDFIPWENVIQVMSDSPNVMRGSKAGVITLIRERFCPKMIDIGGCSLHLINNAVNHATSALGEDIEEFVTDVHSFFKHRTGLMEDYSNVQKLLDVPEHKILRFVGTRWICILPVSERIVEQWDALKVFFDGIKKTQPKVAEQDRFKRIYNNLKNQDLRARLNFIVSALPLFSRFEQLFQKEQPQIHLLHPEMIELIRSILVQFAKPDVLDEVGNITNLTEKIGKSENLLPDRELFIGTPARSILRDMKDSDKRSFYLSVRGFYRTVTSRLLKTLPIDNAMLSHMRFLNPSEKSNAACLTSVVKVATAFHKISNDVCPEKIEREWRLYAIEDLTIEPSSHNISRYWKVISEFKFPNGESKFKNLCMLANLALTLSHGNSDTERSFSESSLILTKQRSQIGIDMLNGLMKIKGELHLKATTAPAYTIPDEWYTYVRDARKKHEEKLANAKQAQENLKREQERERHQREEEKKFAELLQAKKDHQRKIEESVKKIEKEKTHSNKLMAEAEALMKQAQQKMHEASRARKKSDLEQKDLEKAKEKSVQKQLKRASTLQQTIFTMCKKPKVRDVDKVACSLIPQSHRHLTALKTSGDGNCLFNAVSIVVKGDESISERLRQETSDELVRHCERYAKHQLLLHCASEMNANVDTVLQTLLETQDIVANTGLSIKNEGHRTSQDGHWSSMLQVLALSSVLGCAIESVFPQGEHYARNLYHCKVQPLAVSHNPMYQAESFVHKDVIILWSRVSEGPSFPVFLPNHIVPLVPKKYGKI